MMIVRRMTTLCALTLVLFGVAASSSYADVLVTSTFNTDADGWVVKDMPYPTPGNPPAPVGTYAPVFHATGGNPGGYLSQIDPSGNAWYWSAPAKFLGNKQAAYGGTLSFDLAMTGTGTPFGEEDVVLVGGGLTLVLALPAQPGATFTSFRVKLVEGGWKIGSLAGVPATRADLATALKSLTAVYIRGEYRLNLDDVGSIDNVVLEGSGLFCLVELNQATFTDGQQVSAQAFRFVNANSTAVAVEVKAWLEVPGLAPIARIRAGGDSSLSLPAGSNTNIGPLALFTVTPALPRGTYAFNCRILNPTTGVVVTEDINPFEIQ